MRTPAELITARDRVAKVLIKAGIALEVADPGAIEVADFGLSRLEETGLQIVL